MNRLIGSIVLLAGAVAPLQAATTQVPDGKRVALALSLLPELARPSATVILRDSTYDRTVRHGDGFICISDITNRSRLSFSCHAPALAEQIALERELSLAGVSGPEFRNRVCEAARARHIDVPAGAMEITGSLTVDSTGAVADSMTIYRLLWVPFTTEGSIGIPQVDPENGLPWLHRAGTCGAHVMWSEQLAAGH